MASYARAGGINHLDGKNLPLPSPPLPPFRATCSGSCFPAFSMKNRSTPADVETAALMDSVRDDWRTKFYKSLDTPRPARKNGLPGFEPLGHALTAGFLRQSARVRDLLATDTEAAYQGDPAALAKKRCRGVSVHLKPSTVQRLAHELYLQHTSPDPRIMDRMAHSRTGSTCIGGGDWLAFFIDTGRAP